MSLNQQAHYENDNDDSDQYNGMEIAIIGMAGRFPGANSIDEFWQLLAAGKHAISEFSTQELAELGIILNGQDGNYVNAAGRLENPYHFDAEFFGYSPREAEILDPQQRVFLECAWHALENAGYDSEQTDAVIGVFGAAAMSSYLVNLYANADLRSTVSDYELFVANDKDFLASRSAYKLNLTGPCLTVQTACSSSLVAVHLAIQSLLAGECDICLAGGVAINKLQAYKDQEGSILSADGLCRPFDASANGTVPANGIGLVVLKRLEDAINDGDCIDAVIKGSAINNDGANKISFTAPSVDRQADVIRTAQQFAEIEASAVSYLEAHGTATQLGDPVEVTALKEVFGQQGQQHCALGSVKANIGHCDTAAGIASLIKTVLALKHQQIPANPHYQSDNPKAALSGSPFYVNNQLTDWPKHQNTRIAGVSSFGIGGNNAHIIVEEYESQAITTQVNTPQLLVFSAHSPDALQQQKQQFIKFIKANPSLNVADIAYTLQIGRRALKYRDSIACATLEEAEKLSTLLSESKSLDSNTIIFQFPGQGSQYSEMAKNLYAHFLIVQESLDAIFDYLKNHSDTDFKKLLFNTDNNTQLKETQYTQPLLFAVEYAIAQFYLSLGIKPDALHGHSLGEYTAACIAGVFDLKTAVHLVFERGRLMQAAEAGAMLSVFANQVQLQTLITEHNFEKTITIAANNAPSLTAVGGSIEAINAFAALLKSHKIFNTGIDTSHAFHTPSMQSAAQAFKTVLNQCELQAPNIPLMANLTGDWLTEQQATSPEYWIEHLLNAVRFSQGTEKLIALNNPLFIEVGPGKTLLTLVKQQYKQQDALIHSCDKQATESFDILNALGNLWQRGVNIDWQHLPYQNKQRIHLPAYPFASKKYFPENSGNSQAITSSETTNSQSIGHDQQLLIYQPSWELSPASVRKHKASERQRWLLFSNNEALSNALFSELEKTGEEVQCVSHGEAFGQQAYRRFSINSDSVNDYQELFATLKQREYEPTHILYGFAIDEHEANQNKLLATQRLNLLFNELSKINEAIQCIVLSEDAYSISSYENINAEQSTLQGLCQVINQEYPLLAARQLDIESQLLSNNQQKLAKRLNKELHTENQALLTAWRGQHRWQADYKLHSIDEDSAFIKETKLKQGGRYIIIGQIDEGLGKIWASYLAEHYQAQLLILENNDDLHSHLPTALISQWQENAAALEHQLIDCSQAEALAPAINSQQEKWGNFDGLFYSAAMTNQYSAAPLAMLDQQHWQYNMQYKIAPLLAIEKVLKDQTIAFCCLQSSMSSVLGGIGLASYACANHFINQLAYKNMQQGNTAWFAINWDACTDAVPSRSQESNNSRGAEQLHEFTLSGEEVWQQTEAILQHLEAGQILVSKGDLNQRRQQWLSAKPRISVETVGGSKHERPALETPFIAPRNSTEEQVAIILQDLLGITEIGVEENFYDLGGHSLMAIQAIAKLREIFPVDVDMRDLLFESPTTASIAAVIEAKLPKQDELDEIEKLLAEVQSLDN